MINVLVKGTTTGTTTNTNGEFELSAGKKDSVVLIFSAMGFHTVERMISLPSKHSITQIVSPDFKAIREIIIEKKRGNNGLENLSPKLTDRLTTAGGSVETLIKTLPGVSNNNELSSQYSVRGGNFDENLVYVNGIDRKSTRLNSSH